MSGCRDVQMRDFGSPVWGASGDQPARLGAIRLPVRDRYSTMTEVNR